MSNGSLVALHFVHSCSLSACVFSCNPPPLFQCLSLSVYIHYLLASFSSHSYIKALKDVAEILNDPALDVLCPHLLFSMKFHTFLKEVTHQVP